MPVHRRRLVPVLSILTILGPGLVGPAHARQGDAVEVTWRVARVSVSSTGEQPVVPRDRQSSVRVPSISDDGRFVAFSSAADNLVRGDDNRRPDVFVRDRLRDRTVRVSVGSSGRQADGGSFSPTISGNGRFVVFASRATNLARRDRDAKPDIYLHDRRSHVTRLVSVEVPGRWARTAFTAPSVSAGGRFVAFGGHGFDPDTGSIGAVFVRDRHSRTTERVAPTPGGYTAGPLLSARGRFVVLSSTEPLTPGDRPDTSDVFVVDRASGAIRRVAVGTAGGGADRSVVMPSISADARYVAVEVFEGGSQEGTTMNIWVWDRVTGESRILSTTGDGRVLPVGAPPDSPRPAAMSGDGAHVAFVSPARLLPGDRNGTWDVYVRDLADDSLSLVTRGVDGTSADGPSVSVDLSFDGREVAFLSSAANLVPRDTNADDDVFVALRRRAR